MIAALVVLAVFSVLLALYAAVMWFTGSGGPADVMRWWDEGE